MQRMGLPETQFRKEIMIFNSFINPFQSTFFLIEPLKTASNAEASHVSCLTSLGVFDDKEILQKTNGILTFMVNDWFFLNRLRMITFNLIGYR